MSDEEDQTPSSILRLAVAKALSLEALGSSDGESDGSEVLLREMGFDSLALLELGIILEEDFEVEINPVDFSLTPDATYQDLQEFFERVMRDQ